MDANKVIQVINRFNGTLVYAVPDLSIKRVFRPKERKNVTFEELQKLQSSVTGGDAMLRDDLIITDKEALKELLGTVEPEYFYTEKEIKQLMEKGSLNQFLDCLDFAPASVIDLIKDMSVALPLNDMSKRNAIFEKMGFDVTKAIANKQAASESDDNADSESKSTRRSAPITETPSTDEQPARRTSTKIYTEFD